MEVSNMVEKKIYNFYNISLQPILWSVIVTNLYMTVMLCVLWLMQYDSGKYSYLVPKLFAAVNVISIFVIITIIALVIDLVIAIKDGIRNKKENDKYNKSLPQEGCGKSIFLKKVK